ncbi:hypothetical protein BDR04DRAFT_745254 [Suillus decipiens]|nr:hypothetical protein BDR04DRAFT_745254 [Suillus decipiens]
MSSCQLLLRIKLRSRQCWTKAREGTDWVVQGPRRRYLHLLYQFSANLEASLYFPVLFLLLRRHLQHPMLPLSPTTALEPPPHPIFESECDPSAIAQT